MFSLQNEQLLYNITEDKFNFDDCPTEIPKAAEIWRQGSHPLSKGFPKCGQITKGDGYIRCPGQVDECFRNMRELSWKAGPELRAIKKDRQGLWCSRNFVGQAANGSSLDPTAVHAPEKLNSSKNGEFIAKEELSEAGKMEKASSGLFLRS